MNNDFSRGITLCFCFPEASVQAKKSGDTTGAADVKDSSLVGDSTTEDQRVEASSGDTEIPIWTIKKGDQNMKLL